MDLSKLDPTTTRTLDLADTDITDAGLAHLASLTALETLYLSDTRITDSGPAYLRTILPGCHIRR